MFQSRHPAEAARGVRDIAARIAAKDPALLEQFGDEKSPEWESLSLAIDYAARRGLGLIEANDLMVAGMVHASEPQNLRAHFLKNVTADTADTADKKTFRGPPLGWLVLVGILLIVVMFTPELSPVDFFFGLVILGTLLLVVLKVRIAMRLFSRRDTR